MSYWFCGEEMTAATPPLRYSGASRINDLIDEFAEPGQDCLVVPLTQVELAQRWNITAASVQDFLRRQQGRGRVISRSPLVISTTAERRPLRLVTTPPPGNANQLETVTTPLADATGVLLNRTLDLIISAAAAGQVDFAHQLKALITEHLAPELTEPQVCGPSQPRPVEADAAFSAAQNAVRAAENAARSRSSLEKEQEKNFSSRSEEQNAGQNAVRAAGLPTSVIDVVTKRLDGRSYQSDADATLPWARTTWQMARPWTPSEVDDIKRFWVNANIPDQLSSDALAALQLWEPTTAARAITTLAARSDTRNYSARIMDASIWGYHAFYPPQPSGRSPDHAERYKPDELREIGDLLGRFEPDGLIEHLESCASRPHQLWIRVGLAYHLGLITNQQLAELHFIDCADTVMATAAEFAHILEGDLI